MSSEKVKLSKDGSSIDFVASESLPTSLKKFRQSPEIEGFYRFIFENDLQKEAYEILERIVMGRKAKKSAEKAALKEASKAAKDAEKSAAKEVVAPKAILKSKVEASKPTPAKPAAPVKHAAPAAPAKTAAKAAAPTAKHAAPAKPAAKAQAKAAPAAKAKLKPKGKK